MLIECEWGTPLVTALWTNLRQDLRAALKPAKFEQLTLGNISLKFRQVIKTGDAADFTWSAWRTVWLSVR